MNPYHGDPTPESSPLAEEIAEDIQEATLAEVDAQEREEWALEDRIEEKERERDAKPKLEDLVTSAFGLEPEMATFHQLLAAFQQQTGDSSPSSIVDFGLGLGALVLDGRAQVLLKDGKTCYRLRGPKEIVAVSLYVLNRIPEHDDKLIHASTVMTTVDQVAATRDRMGKEYESDPYLSELGAGAYQQPKYLVEVETEPEVVS